MPAHKEQVYRFIESDTPLKSFTGQGPACANDYQGIGVRIQPGSNEVLEVAAGGPASVAGVLVGDILLNEGSFWRDTGTLVEVRVKRNGKEIKLSAIVDKICRRQ